MITEAYMLMRHYFDMIYLFLSNITIPGTTLSVLSFFVGILAFSFIIFIVKMFFKTH